MTKFKVGVVGCGNISNIYLESPGKFPFFEITAVADINAERAKEQAEKHKVAKVLSVDDLISSPDIDVVLNLTVPAAHYSVCSAAVAHHKHVYVEKPLAISFEEGKRLIALANENRVRVGCAPDTFLGGGLQTCRQLIDDGVIGTPVAAAGYMMGHGPEAWHPDPDFFYKTGAGPLFDMGPYYITALISLLGPINAVTAMSRISFAEREVGSGPKKGEKIAVETQTHVAGSLEFGSGVIGTLSVSFDVWSAQVPNIEIYGSKGTLSVPDPNSFGGPVRLKLAESAEWEEIKIERPYTENSRGIGLADMVEAIAQNRNHRASGDLGLHTLETMHGLLMSSKERRFYTLESTVSRPDALPSVWP